MHLTHLCDKHCSQNWGHRGDQKALMKLKCQGGEKYNKQTSRSRTHRQVVVSAIKKNKAG